MGMKRGRDRLVLIFPLLGVVVKFPVIHFFEAFRRFFYYRRCNRRMEYLKKYFTGPLESYISIGGLLLRGLSANWNEFSFYQKTKSQFLQPTYFSFFGFLNVQRYDELCQLQAIDLWRQLYEITEGKVFDDSHHFANPSNFCFCNGILRMLDYGSHRSHGVVTQYGAKIVEIFNPAYCWEEEKKKLEKME